jgi:hypothetical protein
MLYLVPLRARFTGGWVTVVNIEGVGGIIEGVVGILKGVEAL